MNKRTLFFIIFLFSSFSIPLSAEVKVPSIFTDHMVLQRQQANKVWGWAKPDEKVAISIAEQSHSTKADTDGKWQIVLEPMEAGGLYTLKIKGENTVCFKDVLVGEVWLCSGQSNMQWPVKDCKDYDLEKISANFPQIRCIGIDAPGSPERQENFNGKEWQVCSPETVEGFSAVGYYFAHRLHNTLGIPVGLISNAWGGSPIEAWLPREEMEKYDRYAEYLEEWDKKMAEYTDDVHAEKMAEWKVKCDAWIAEGEKGRQPGRPGDPRYGRDCPGNIFNSRIYPVVNYGIRGAIWYQGETNAMQSRHDSYAHQFKLLIKSWRENWNQGDFPFYWVQLADWKAESPEPHDTNWARLREAQTMTIDTLPKTGQAVIIDSGEAQDIHPRDKQTVANRLARWALANDYGYKISFRSPQYKSMEIKGRDALITFDHVSNSGLYAFDIREPIGFAIAGKDTKFVWAKAEIVGKNQVKVWSEEVDNPVAVRYAWADNPVANLYDRNGLPVTPFRTDDWPQEEE